LSGWHGGNNLLFGIRPRKATLSCNAKYLAIPAIAGANIGVAIELWNKYEMN
jgi:hypothetical protein